MNFIKKFSYNSPVIISFFILSLVVLISGMSSFLTLRFSSFSDINMYLKLLTYPFAHANFNHFINNFLLILVVGPGVEERYGSKLLLIMIMITSIMTGFCNIVFFSGTGLLGASGIAFMLIVVSSYTNVRKGAIPITFILVLFLYVGREIFNAISINDGVSQFAHIMGGIMGAVFCFLIPKSKSNSFFKKKSRFENTEPMNKV